MAKGSEKQTVSMNPRQQLLTEAMDITSADRNKAYGAPEDNFRNIATYWNQHILAAKNVQVNLTPSDVAAMMMLMKLARLSTNPTHRDSLVDVAGYAACAADCIVSYDNGAAA